MARIPGPRMRISLPAKDDGVPERAGRDPLVEKLDRFGRGVFRGRVPHDLQDRAGGGVGLAALPIIADLAGVLEVGFVRTGRLRAVESP